MESSGSGKDREEDCIQGPARVHGQCEDSNTALSTGAPSPVVAEGHAVASSPLPPSAPSFRGQGGSGGPDHAESSSAAAEADREGKNVAASLSPGTGNDEQREFPGAKRTFLSKISNCSKNSVLCRKGFDQTSTGSSSNKLSKESHVAEKTIPFSNALIHYDEQIRKLQKTTGVIATNGVDLCQHFSEFRTVEGDGECFYRSFIFSYLEQVLDRRDRDEERRLLRAVEAIAMEHARFEWTSEFSRSCKAFKNLVEKVMSWKIHNGVLKIVATTGSYRKQKLLNFFSTYDETEDIFVFLRLVAAIWICSNRAEYEERVLREVGPYGSLQDYCSRNVIPRRAVADSVQIRALAAALGVPLIVQGLGEGAFLDVNFGDSPVHVTLLLTFKHYDIIYSKELQKNKGRGRPRILAPRHDAYTSRAHRVHDSIDLCPRSRRPGRATQIDWQSILRAWPEDEDPCPDI